MEPVHYPPVERLLYEHGYLFDFFQAVRLLEQRKAQPVGGTAAPHQEAVRFRGLANLHFPPSAIDHVSEPEVETAIPVMTVTFFGLLGTVGALPRHYTELVMRHEKENKGEEAGALRAWYDIFNHRLVSLFFRAWKKYRFWMTFERGEHLLPEPDAFTQAVSSLVGLGSPGLRNRLRMMTADRQPRRLTKVDDQAIYYYGGLFAPRVRNALSLEAILEDYFNLPVEVRQFQGQWLQLDAANRSHLGEAASNNLLGVNSVAGQRVLDVQGRLCVRLGPLTYEQFAQFLPNRAAVPEGKTYFQLVHLQRLYIGQEFDVDVQLVLKAEETPECQLPVGTDDGPQLGWNGWLHSQTPEADRDDAVFQE